MCFLGYILQYCVKLKNSLQATSKIVIEYTVKQDFLIQKNFFINHAGSSQISFIA